MTPIEKSGFLILKKTKFIETFRVRLVVDKNGIKRVENVDKKLKSVYSSSVADATICLKNDLNFPSNKFQKMDQTVVQLQG